MKTSTALLVFGIYSIITGAMMLFNAAGALHDYGLTTIDAYHIAILQYLGITDIGFGILGVRIRNSPDANSTQSYLLASAFLALASVLKGAYDFFGLGIPASNFFWVDMSVRGVVGLACLYFAFKKR